MGVRMASRFGREQRMEWVTEIFIVLVAYGELKDVY